MDSNLGSRGGPVHVGLIVKLLKLLQCCAWLLGKTNDDSLAVVVSDGQTRRGALLRGFEQVVDAIAVDLEVLQSNLDLCGTGRVFLDLLASPVY